LMLDYFGANQNVNFVLSASIIFIIRLVAVRFHLQLPKIKDDLFDKS